MDAIVDLNAVVAFMARKMNTLLRIEESIPDSVGDEKDEKGEVCLGSSALQSSDLS